jgi:mono/diheme cytochrome c family protein
MVAALWNHGPAMWSEMQALGIPVPQLEDREMADLLAYLSFLQFANADGDAAKGAAIFRDKSCVVCHSAATGTASRGPTLAQSAGTRSPLDWAAAMWNHAPPTVEKLSERSSSWPRFEDDEMRDLASFLRAPVEGDRQ